MCRSHTARMRWRRVCRRAVLFGQARGQKLAWIGIRVCHFVTQGRGRNRPGDNNDNPTCQTEKARGTTREKLTLLDPDYFGKDARQRSPVSNLIC